MKPAIDVGTTEQITANFKAAGQLVKKQAIRTKLATVDLPKALVSLGKYVYGLDNSRTRFEEQCQVIERLRAKIEDVVSVAKRRPTAEGVAAKAQGLIQGAGDLAQRKLLENQLATAYSNLGGAASTHDIPGGEPLLTAVSVLRNQIATLESEITALSKMAPAGGWLTPTRILLAGAVLGAGLLAAVVLRSSGRQASRDPFAKDKMELSALGDAQIEKIRRGDALWDKQKFDGAAAVYAEVIEKERKTFGGTKAADSLSQPAGRLVDHIAGKAGVSAATEFARKALDMSVTPLVTTEAGSRAVESARNDQMAEENQRRSDRGSRDIATDTTTNPSSEKNENGGNDSGGGLPTRLTGVFGERIGPDFTTEELRAIAGRFIQNKVRPGWELNRVLSLLGKPSNYSRTNGLVGQSPEQQKKFMDDPLIPPGVKQNMRKELVICTWSDASDPGNRFIRLAFVEGRLSGDDGAIVVQLAK